MPAHKGHAKVGGGSRKNRPNKTTTDVRKAIALIAEHKASQVEGWLETVAAEDPGKAVDLYLRMIEYHIPKLQRTELSGPDGSALTIASTVRFVDADAKSKD